MNKPSLSQQIINSLGISLISIGVFTLGINYSLLHDDLENQFQQRIQSLNQTLVFATESLLDINDISIVQRIVQNYATLPEVIEVTILNPDGTILANAPKQLGKISYSLSDKNINKIVKQVNHNSREINFKTTINNQKVIVNILPFSSVLFEEFQSRGLAIIIIDLSIMHQEVYQIFLTSSLPMMTGTIMILILIGFLMKKNIIKPLEKLNQAVIESQKIDIFSTPKYLPNQEIYFLATTFKQIFQRRIKIELELKESEKREKKKSQELEKTIQELQITQVQLIETERIAQLNQELLESQSRYQAVVKQTSEGLVLIDANSKQIMEANEAFCHLLNYTQSEIVKLTIYDLSSLNSTETNHLFETLLGKKDNLFLEYILTKKDGSLIETEVNVSLITYRQKNIFCLSVRDITERKLTENLLHYQAFYDSLTNIPNRAFLNTKINEILEQSKENSLLFAVIFMDLDRFKVINDTLGHNIGDQLLQSCAQRIKNCLEKEDLIARWGGDEFIIIIPNFDNLEKVTQIANQILAIVKTPFQIENHQFYISSSMGIALYPQDGTNQDTLIKNADIALYQAKDKGRNNYQFYRPKMNEEASELLLLEGYLHKALANNELLLYYQPQINLNTGKIYGLEALIRWKHPELGLISPAKFIPLAEETGLILSIGEWVLKTACAQNKAWQKAGLPPVKISVNISPLQFQQTNLLEIINNILVETELESHWLELEITESSLMHNIDFAISLLGNIVKIGVNISMDDFGTGYSSLSYLKKFPFNTIKIDQSFVRDLKENSPDLGIIEAVVALGRNFNLNVIAEGVEKEYQLNILKKIGCHLIQGYLFSKPLPLEEATKFLEMNHKSCVITNI